MSSWTHRCPVDLFSVLFQKNISGLGFASCFHRANMMAFYDTVSFKISTYSSPRILVASIENSMPSTISSIISINRTFYNQNVAANYMVSPSIKYVKSNAIIGSSYIFLVDINTVLVSIKFPYTINSQQHLLHSKLSLVDYCSGMAFSIITPLLWALSVAADPENLGITPVFIVPGIVGNKLVRQIVERSITIIMDTLGVQGPRPEYVFTSSVEQFINSEDFHDVGERKLLYTHRDLCDRFYQDNANTAFDCLNPIQGSLVSTFDIQGISRGVRLNQDEFAYPTILLAELISLVQLGVHQRDVSNSDNCPQKMVQKQNDIHQQAVCYICESTHYFKDGICTACTQMLNTTCPVPFLIRTFSWSHNSQCIDLQQTASYAYNSAASNALQFSPAYI